MANKKNPLLFSLLFAVLFSSLAARAENVQDFGDYVVHFNALNTDMLPPKVAQEYAIKRSQNRGMLNIVVLKKVLGASGTPTPARVSGTSTSLTGRQRELEFREIREPNALYYIAEFPVSHEESLDFRIRVQPKGVAEPFLVHFRQQFFTR
ncbi:DUF4426 domain-containing protein [Thiohalobacter sp. IOR34]|uniref:DUF4426 domain-containing protein n=1 Tax=Thiohalobacter sp. IOR34 TaxID=3057176 RepID=UPI0025AF59A1|nr:DUF4426 domain-containing protein [Thiohalobacter sp. IOR34]WJW75774.1 DUF4426 domain-containing protein [Thiohalobacter sp. IOR34]